MARVVLAAAAAAVHRRGISFFVGGSRTLGK